MYSNKLGVQQLCLQLQAGGVKYVVICPGSRHAPIVQTLYSLGSFELFSIPDERTAGFFALGLAQERKQKVAIVTTSGTAPLNLAPAVAEAYYRHIPLLIITGDRPAKWIDNGDGQSIQQIGIYRNFIESEFNLPQDGQHSQEELEEELKNLAIQLDNQRGPIHVNVPMDEPLYDFESTIHAAAFPSVLESTIQDKHIENLENELASVINTNQRILVIVGQKNPDTAVDQNLERLRNLGLVILHENLANVQIGAQLYLFDLILSKALEEDYEALAPTVVIQIGEAIVSKRLKAFLRTHQPRHLYYIDQHARVPNVFDTKLTHIKSDPLDILSTLNLQERLTDFARAWASRHKLVKEKLRTKISNAAYSDLTVINFCLKNMEPNSVVHLGNSSPVRYAQFTNRPDLEYYCNRGVSGIDGCVSTAAGHAFFSPATNFLIVGDISFFYDSNAFWTQPQVRNLKIILINNGGGNIFSMIKGPSQSDIMEQYQMTPHQLAARWHCEHFRIKYFLCNEMPELEQIWSKFIAEEGVCLIEIQTEADLNAQVYKNLFTTEN